MGRRVIPKSTIENVMKLYNEKKLTVDQISQICGVARSTIYRLLNGHVNRSGQKINPENRKTNFFFSKENRYKLAELYNDKGLGTVEIGRILNISNTIISQELARGRTNKNAPYNPDKSERYWQEKIK